MQKMSKSLFDQSCTYLMSCDTHDRNCPRCYQRLVQPGLSKIWKIFPSYGADKLGHTDGRTGAGNYDTLRKNVSMFFSWYSPEVGRRELMSVVNKACVVREIFPPRAISVILWFVGAIPYTFFVCFFLRMKSISDFDSGTLSKLYSKMIYEKMCIFGNITVAWSKKKKVKSMPKMYRNVTLS